MNVLLHHFPNLGYTALWAISQWFPIKSFQSQWQQRAWKHWEENTKISNTNASISTALNSVEISVVDVQKHRNDILVHLEETYGPDWRKRPLLLRGLWTPAQLRNSSRKLSLKGLLQEELVVPYFSDARRKDALTPDRTGRIKDIVRNMTEHGTPHKLGTQHLVQTYPELIREVAPNDIVTKLFRDFFEPQMVKGSGPFGMFPAMTTVPLFVAHSQHGAKQSKPKDESTVPFTGLHCEPIGNVAVQLSGQKQWTLVSPEYSYLVRPSLAPDGRAFFASHADLSHCNTVPFYSATTRAGDAIWVPTWTWHRVDYLPSKDIAIGGSLFHFRPRDFVANNPLFAAMIIPALVLELFGYNTQ
ncbi:hypothetical protein MPSEU_000862400 [Mayamaea pseudoterrestris]|nr:hypothetical protein MPSEU_000862400 [Mayamaea pseudoterrestris]